MDPAANFGLDGQTAIITGGSKGIGKAIAERFAASGANVVICSRTQADVDAVAEDINEAEGGRCLAVECNVRELDDVEALVEATVEEFGGVDVVVNNAGGEFVAPFDDISDGGWEAVLDVNLVGTARVARVAGKHMQENGGGDIINLSSVNGQHAAPYESHYGAAKAGVISLTKTLAAEWAGHNIRVNCVAPGLIQTPGVAEVLGVDADDLPDRDSIDRVLGHPDEIADVIHFMASPANSFMTGETVTAKGKLHSGFEMDDLPAMD
jgi:NAD(P)-dependent dehydrogenase (short-subunit alcohol dehydrogenase family)